MTLRTWTSATSGSSKSRLRLSFALTGLGQHPFQHLPGSVVRAQDGLAFDEVGRERRVGEARAHLEMDEDRPDLGVRAAQF